MRAQASQLKMKNQFRDTANGINIKVWVSAPASITIMIKAKPRSGSHLRDRGICYYTLPRLGVSCLPHPIVAT